MRETATIAGRYEASTELGRGSAGIVQLARDLATQREVAIKTILWPNGIAESDRDAYRQRFLDGMREASRLTHPGIVAVHEYGAAEGESPFVVMDYVKGPTLHELICKEGLKAEWVLSAADTLVAAVRAARHQGQVHPDLKPSNVLVRETDGEVKLADYGLPRFDASETDGARGIRGSQAYLSPEGIQGRPTDIRSDLFSISVILYEMLCGLLPFRGSDAEGLRRAIIEDPVPSVTNRANDLCPGFDPFFARALAKDPARRFSNAESFREALERLREEQRRFWSAAPAVPASERDARAGAATPAPVPGVDRDASAKPDRSSLDGAATSTATMTPAPAVGVDPSTKGNRSHPAGAATSNATATPAVGVVPSTKGDRSRPGGAATSNATATATVAPEGLKGGTVAVRSGSLPTSKPRAGAGAPGRSQAPSGGRPANKDDGPSVRGPGDVRPFPRGQSASDPGARRVANLLWIWGGIAAMLLLVAAVWTAWSLGEDGTTATSADRASSAPASSSSTTAPHASGAREGAPSLPATAGPALDPGTTRPGSAAAGASTPTAASGTTAKVEAGGPRPSSKPKVTKKTPAASAAAPADPQPAAIDPALAVVEPAVAPAPPEPAAPVAARLALVVKSSFKDADLQLFVDGEEVYAASLASDARGITRVYKKAVGKAHDSVEAGIDVAAGRHTILAKVHNTAKDRSYEESLDVELAPAEQRTLRIVAGRSIGPRLELELE